MNDKGNSKDNTNIPDDENIKNDIFIEDNSESNNDDFVIILKNDQFEKNFNDDNTGSLNDSINSNNENLEENIINWTEFYSKSPIYQQLSSIYSTFKPNLFLTALTPSFIPSFLKSVWRKIWELFLIIGYKAKEYWPKYADYFVQLYLVEFFSIESEKKWFYFEDLISVLYYSLQYYLVY